MVLNNLLIKNTILVGVMFIIQGFFSGISDAKTKSFFLKSNLFNNKTTLTNNQSILLDRSTENESISIEFKKDVPKSVSEFKLNTWTGRLLLDGKQVCDSYLKASQLINQDAHLVLAKMLSDEQIQSAYGLVTKIDDDLLNSELEYHLSSLSGESIPELTKTEECLTFKDGEFFETHIYNYRHEGGLFELRYLDHDLTVNKISFHSSFNTEGTVHIYKNRKEAGAVIEPIAVSGLKGDGTLTSSEFYIDNGPDSPDHIYNYSDETDAFAQASIFYWAGEQIDFYKNIGYVPYNEMPIKITYPDLTQDDNGSYLPSGSSEVSPEIRISRGENYLQNLGFDEDVISHEIGHHIIFEYIYSIGANSEALILHEGLADFFVHARTGDTCLGESICVNDSSQNKICYLVPEDSSAQSCLRHAEVDFKYNDSVYSNLNGAHLKSQIISSFLHGVSLAMDPGEIEVLAYEALKLVPPNSNIEIFVLALFYSDLNNFAGAYREVIRSAADNYGLGEFASSIPTDLSEELPQISEVQTDQSSSEVAMSSTSSKPWWHFGCAIVPEKVQTPTNTTYNLAGLLLLMMFLAPCLTVFRSK